MKKKQKIILFKNYKYAYIYERIINLSSFIIMLRWKPDKNVLEKVFKNKEYESQIFFDKNDTIYFHESFFSKERIYHYNLLINQLLQTITILSIKMNEFLEIYLKDNPIQALNEEHLFFIQNDDDLKHFKYIGNDINFLEYLFESLSNLSSLRINPLWTYMYVERISDLLFEIMYMIGKQKTNWKCEDCETFNNSFLSGHCKNFKIEPFEYYLHICCKKLIDLTHNILNNDINKYNNIEE